MDSNTFAENLAFNYSEYLSVDLSQHKEQVFSLVSKLEKQLEEISSLLESVNVDTSLCIDSLLPEIAPMYEALKVTFDQIDKLERFVATVEKSVTNMENCVTKAETQLSEGNSVFSVLKPLLWKVKTKPVTTASFNAPEIFSTEKLVSELLQN